MATFLKMWLLWVLVDRKYVHLLVLKHNNDGNLNVGWTAKVYVRCALTYMYWLNLFNTINWHDTTLFDSEDDYHTGCQNVSHCKQQQSYLGLRSPGWSYSTCFCHNH